MQRRDQIVEEVVRRVVQDGGQGALHQRVAAQDAHGQVGQPAPHLPEHPVPVVHDDPAHAPARHQEALGQPAARQHRDALGQRADRVELLPGKDEMLVDLVRNDRHKVPLGNVHDRLQVGARKHAAARVARIRHDQRARLLVDQLLELDQVRLPVALRQQIVRPALDAEPLRQRPVDREARLRHQNVPARPAQHRDAEVERAAAPAAQDHVRRRHWPLVLHVPGDRFPRLQVAVRRRVPIAAAVLERLPDRVDRFLRRFEVAERGRITCGWAAICSTV
uniref:Uncharacterized protein n=1 Tax=Anopheles coluzzii TaxID=1518534 RepID=A0A8W7PZG3_ANOCL